MNISRYITAHTVKFREVFPRGEQNFKLDSDLELGQFVPPSKRIWPPIILNPGIIIREGGTDLKKLIVVSLG